MATRPPRGETRRTVLRAAAGVLAAPALLRGAPAEAALASDAGSTLIIGFDGNTAMGEAARGLADAVRFGWAGGVMFHRRNIGSREDFRGLVELFEAPACGRSLPSTRRAAASSALAEPRGSRASRRHAMSPPA